MTEEEIEAFAIRCALGNNGGEWAKHYTDDHKNYWRQFVRDLEASVLGLGPVAKDKPMFYDYLRSI